jgi:hypothetical protein
MAVIQEEKDKESYSVEDYKDCRITNQSKGSDMDNYHFQDHGSM